MDNILIVYRSHIDRAAPIISIAQTLINSGYRVSWLSPHDQSYDFNCGISIFYRPFRLKNNSFISKKINDFIWGIEVLKTMREFDRVYIVGADTIISTFLSRFFNIKLYYHLRELHDKNFLYMFLLRIILPKNAKVIVPEINRAHLYKHFLNLSSLPCVLPNMALKQSTIKQINKKYDLPNKFLLYQGSIHKERDLTNICHSILNLNLTLVCMGRDFGMLSVYKSILKERLIHINHISPPNHLLITRYALAGIAFYDKKSLNSVYCAPNKLWEYTSNGVPIISSDNPSMICDVKVNKIGIIINEGDAIDDLTNKLQHLLKNRKDYSINCLEFYRHNILNYNKKINEIFI